VRLARDWVTGVLEEIGRGELAESARLAVSELVTNAILHAEPPMTVHVRGTVEHPRVEVTDQSLVPPQRLSSAHLIDLGDDLSWPTLGRGLDLVAAYSERWGADISPTGAGKVVWFEPSDGMRETPVEGEVFDVDAEFERLGLPATRAGATIDIRFLGMPVELFATLRRHFNELGRELRLLALSEPDRYPLAVEFSDTFLEVEYQRRQVAGIEALDAAIDRGGASVDLAYTTPATAPATMLRLQELIPRVYDELSGTVLLSVPPPPELVALEEWYLGEFSRQAAGEPPMRWDGPLRLRLAAEREVS
jgi:hypothetical protein